MINTILHIAIAAVCSIPLFSVAYLFIDSKLEKRKAAAKQPLKFESLNKNKNMKTLDQLIAETNGKFFSVTFIKKDGSVRTINGKDKYRRLLAGGTNRVAGLGYVSFVNRNASNILTKKGGQWACAHKEGVITFKCGEIKVEFVKA